MFVRVLGSAAGGGFPQWNCGCFNCAGVREGKIRAKPRTQESVAVSADGERWVLLNASPEIRAQIESFPKLHPRGPRHSPIQGIVLTNGDLDHCLGLLCLRESYPLTVAASQSVEEGFTSANPLYRFAADHRKGRATGQGIQGFGGTWHVVTASSSTGGTVTMPTTTTTTTTTPPCLYPPCY